MDSTNDEWFVVKNLDDFINATRALVFNNFGKHSNDEPDLLSFSVHPDDIKEIDTILSFEESKLIINSIIKKQQNIKTKKYRYMINDSLYMDVVSSLNDRMVSNILNSLVNKGLVESAYDNESNDFVFWIKNHDQQKPETD
jgi:hypothetical protein